MAKKKSKKTSKNSIIFKAVILALGVIAFCMAFVTSVKFTGKLVEESFTGFQVMFGYSEKTTLATLEYLSFSFMGLLTFALPLIGAILSCLNNKIARIVGACLMIVGAVLMFIVPSFVVFATASNGNLTAAAATIKACESSLGIGAILGGVFSALGGLVAGYTIFKK